MLRGGYKVQKCGVCRACARHRSHGAWPCIQVLRGSRYFWLKPIHPGYEVGTHTPQVSGLGPMGYSIAGRDDISVRLSGPRMEER